MLLCRIFGTYAYCIHTNSKTHMRTGEFVVRSRNQVICYREKFQNNKQFRLKKQCDKKCKDLLDFHKLRIQ